MANIASVAESYIGKSKSSLDVCDGAWCASFASLVMRKAGAYKANDVSSISCNNMIAAMRKNGYKEVVVPFRNCIIFFDWDHLNEPKPADHVGIVTGVSGNTITYVNGNGNDPERVTQQSIQINSSYIFAIFAEPEAVETYTKVDVEFGKGSKGPIVKLIQSIVGVTTDGMFGPHTEKAVKEFQRTHNIDVDGVVGDDTLTHMSHEIFK